MPLADWLKAERKRIDVSQDALGAAVGASGRAVQDWERGVSQPNATYLAGMAALGMDVVYVLCGIRMPDELRERFTHASRATLEANVGEGERERLAQLNLEAMRMALVPPISADETNLVRRYRSLSPEGRTAVERMIEALGGKAAPPGKSSVMKRSKVTIHGDVGQQIKGDVHNTAPFTINVGGKKPKR